MITVGIITVSDRVSRGEYEDKGGPALQQFCEKCGWSVTAQAVVPDEEALIGDKTQEFAGICSLVLLTGGTGIAECDVTPEAVRAIADKELPGFGEVMRAKSFDRFPHAILSRSFAAVVDDALVICLPGSPKGAVECLEFVAEAIPHAIELLTGDTTHPPPNS
ncbi:MAG TPA: MogA/MoaB family molybdenum cofactor biosynthesis protein [Verrucomicrobiae bacterium]|nr:MogA/MoaB family molybdenum cofactor biosynthesis protein [Verrucomicrobiae bacterium]